MPSLASISSLPKTSLFSGHRRPRGLFVFPRLTLPTGLRFRSRVAVVSASLSSDGRSTPEGRRAGGSKNSILSNMIQEIEPLDISLIQKDVPKETIDAMKRTISSMLGLLPSDQFRVCIEALWGPLSKLLVSSMMTGYTLRNVEYRLCLERNLGIQEQSGKTENDGSEVFLDRNTPIFKPQKEIVDESSINEMNGQDLGEMTPKVQEYILHLQSRLSSVKKELHDLKRERTALQTQHLVGREKNELLDYLRSLQPEKVAELSEPTCPEVQETIHTIVHGLLATLSPKIQTKAPPLCDAAAAAVNLEAADSDDCAVENTSLNFHPLISVSRDYLARLLFWCMLLGHYIRGLEYRLELTALLAISSDGELRE